MHKEIIVDLNDKIKVADGKGDFVEVSQVRLVCGTQALIDDIDVVKCSFHKAQMSAFKLVDLSDVKTKDKAEVEEETEEQKAKSHMQFMYMGLGSKDMQKLRSSFTRMLYSGCMKIDDVNLINSGLVKKLSIADMDSIMGRYLANFME